MQRIGDEYPVTDDRGNGVPNAVVTLYKQGSVTPLPSVYEATGSALTPGAKANPMTTDALGRWSCALPDGRYKIEFSGGTFPTYSIENICVFDNTVTYPSPALGTVTSVALSGPAIFTYSAAVTGAGTLTMTLATQTANTIWSGPTTGAAAAPTFRVMVLADLPSFGPTASSTFGSATQVAQVTTNAQGIITGIANVTVTPAWSSVTGKPSTVVGRSMTDQVACVFRQTASVTAGNTTTETDLVSTGAGSKTLAANQLVGGSTVRVKARGYGGYGGGGTVQVKLKLGASTVIDTGALNPGAWGASMPFDVDVSYTVRTTGGGGTGIGQISFTMPNGATGDVFDVPYAMTGTSSVDTTASNAVALTFQWGTAAASNTITCTNLQIFLEG